MPDRLLDDNGMVLTHPEPVDLDAPDRDPMAVVDCELCDEHGYRGATVCDHVDRTETAKRGHELIQAELARIRERRANAKRVSA